MPRLVTTLAVALVALVAHGDAQAPASSTNAALRYWMAFAVLRDPPADQATAELLDRVAAGTTPWDETKLGKILDDNGQALAIMFRATQLPSCDWGLEYELGPNTPIAHLPKARVLGRLNAVAGARLASRGQWPQAVDLWLAGVRFSQHVAHDGTLISLLSARLSLSPSLKSLARAAAQPAVDAARRRQIADVVRAIPDAGFEWTAAMRREADLLVVAKRLNPKVNAVMPSQTRVNSTADEIRAERKAVLDAVSQR
jgi:hypothetical protein